MRKKIASLFVIFLLGLLFIMIIIFSDSVMSSVSFSISIWKDNLIPAIFPFFVLSELMINYGTVEFLGLVFGRFMRRFFLLPGASSFAIVGSMISGFPSGSKYIVDLLKSNLITLDDANYLIMFTHFSNPIFIIGSIGVLMLGNIEIGYLILLIHFLTNFVIAFFARNRRKKLTFINRENRLININNKNRNNNFIVVLTNAILNSFRTLLLILGIIIVFLVITTIIDNVFSLDQLTSAFVSGILEITQGIKKVSYLNIPMCFKASIIAFFISFGGFSVHFQILSIIEGTNIKYKYFFLSRIVHALISGILVFALLC